MSTLTEHWVKSTKSSPSCDNCVEVRFDGEHVFVRNSNYPQAGTLAFTREEWTAFRGGVADGEFQLPA